MKEDLGLWFTLAMSGCFRFSVFCVCLSNAYTFMWWPLDCGHNPTLCFSFNDWSLAFLCLVAVTLGPGACIVSLESAILRESASSSHCPESLSDCRTGWGSLVWAWSLEAICCWRLASSSHCLWAERLVGFCVSMEAGDWGNAVLNMVQEDQFFCFPSSIGLVGSFQDSRAWPWWKVEIRDLWMWSCPTNSGRRLQKGSCVTTRLDTCVFRKARPGKGADSPGLTLARRVCRTDCAGGALGSPMFLFIYPDFGIRYTDCAIYLF